MGDSIGNFRAWYETDKNLNTKIIVAGNFTEVDGGKATLVRAEASGDSLILMLRIDIAPYAGVLVPHTAQIKALRYEETTNRGNFSEVHIQGPSDEWTVNVDTSI
jgi:hypothetical protein